MKQILKDQLIEVYNEEARTYDVTRSFYESGYGGLREKKLLSLYCRGPKVLNIGCGTGRILRFLLKNDFYVVGIDFSKGMLRVAKNTTKSKNLDLIVADAEFLPFREDVFDEVVCSRAFKFFINPQNALDEGFRVINSGGVALFSMETSDPFWIRLGYSLKIPYMGAKFEWRYRAKNVQSLFKKAKFESVFTLCVIYFGKTIYQIAFKYFRPSLKILELIDSHNHIGRNVMFVGIKA